MQEHQQDTISATFEPSEAYLLKNSSNNKLLTESPILASALSNIFPYLLLIDNLLEIVTWTNDDHYQNFLIMVFYSLIVVYWNILSCVILPLLITILFSCVVWSISSVVHESKYEETPTIDEVLYTLHNITIRFEMMLRPVKHFDLERNHFLKMFFMSTITIPLHALLVNTFIGLQRYVWISGIVFLSYHSPWSFAIRRLLWRSVYIKIIAFYFIGSAIQLEKESPEVKANSEDGFEEHDVSMISDFKVLRKYIVSPTQIKQDLEIEIYENERRWIGIGWSKVFLPSERSAYCYEGSLAPAPSIDNFTFPVINDEEYDYLWKWSETFWNIDKEFNKGRDDAGWVYYDNSWTNQSYEDGFSKYTRSRKWTRKGVLTIEKKKRIEC